MWPGGGLAGARGEAVQGGLMIEASKTQSRRPPKSLPSDSGKALIKPDLRPSRRDTGRKGPGEARPRGSGQGPAGQKIPEDMKDSVASYL